MLPTPHRPRARPAPAPRPPPAPAPSADRAAISDSHDVASGAGGTAGNDDSAGLANALAKLLVSDAEAHGAPLGAVERTHAPPPVLAAAVQPEAAASVPAPPEQLTCLTAVVAEAIFSAGGPLIADVVVLAAADDRYFVVPTSPLAQADLTEALNSQCGLPSGSTGPVSARQYIDALFGTFLALFVGIWFRFQEKWYGFYAHSEDQTTFYFDIVIAADAGGGDSSRPPMLHLERITTPLPPGSEPTAKNIAFTVTNDEDRNDLGSLDDLNGHEIGMKRARDNGPAPAAAAPPPPPAPADESRSQGGGSRRRAASRASQAKGLSSTSIIIAASLLLAGAGITSYTNASPELYSQTPATVSERDAPSWLAPAMEAATAMAACNVFEGAMHFANFFSPHAGKYADDAAPIYSDSVTQGFIRAVAGAAGASEEVLAAIPTMTRIAILDMYQKVIFTSAPALRAAAAASLSVRLRELVFDQADDLVSVSVSGAQRGLRHFIYSNIDIPSAVLAAANAGGYTLSAILEGSLTYQYARAYWNGYIFCANGSPSSNAICTLNGFHNDGFTRIVPLAGGADSASAGSFTSSAGSGASSEDPLVFVPALVHAVAAWNAGHLALALALWGIAFPGGTIVAWSLFNHGHAWASIILPSGRRIKMCLILVLECILSRKLVASNTSSASNRSTGPTDEGLNIRALTVGCLGGYLCWLNFGSTGGVMRYFYAGLKALLGGGGAVPVLDESTIADICASTRPTKSIAERRYTDAR